MPRVPITRPGHRTVGAHVSEALWQSVMYLAEVDNVSASELVRNAVEAYMVRRHVTVATYAEIIGQRALAFEGGADVVRE